MLHETQCEIQFSVCDMKISGFLEHDNKRLITQSETPYPVLDEDADISANHFAEITDCGAKNKLVIIIELLNLKPTAYRLRAGVAFNSARGHKPLSQRVIVAIQFPDF